MVTTKRPTSSLLIIISENSVEKSIHTGLIDRVPSFWFLPSRISNRRVSSTSLCIYMKTTRWYVAICDYVMDSSNGSANIDDLLTCIFMTLLLPDKSTRYFKAETAYVPCKVVKKSRRKRPTLEITLIHPHSSNLHPQQHNQPYLFV